MASHALSPEIRRLREGKAQLRLQRRSAPLEDKVQNLLHLQRLYVDIAATRRPLLPWQRPWNITSTVNDAVIVTNDLVSSRPVRALTAACSQWIRPSRRLALGT